VALITGNAHESLQVIKIPTCSTLKIENLPSQRAGYYPVNGTDMVMAAALEVTPWFNEDILVEPVAILPHNTNKAICTALFKVYDDWKARYISKQTSPSRPMPQVGSCHAMMQDPQSLLC
jgi:hypothetical protein